MRVTLPNQFKPRPYQSRYMSALDDGCKRAVAVWHRRAGKDLVDLHEAVKLAHDPALRGVYWTCLPTEAQARKALWNGISRDGRRIMEWVFPSPIRKSPREWSPNGTMLVELRCGSIFQLVGSDNIDSLVGAGPRRVAFSEYALSRPSAWDRVRPMLEENGGSASFLSTPRGRNHLHSLYQIAKANPAEWYSDLVDIFQSGAFHDPQAVIDKAIAEGMPASLVDQEYRCSFEAANAGSIYGDLLAKLATAGGLDAFEHDRDNVVAAFDLGVRDNAAVWLFRVEGDEVQLIDCHSCHGKPASYYLDWLEGRSEVMGFKYKTIWLPHDGRARTFATGTTTQEEFMGRFPGHIGIVPSLSLADGIQATRKMLQGKLRIHPRCAEGVEALRDYSYSFDEDEHTYSSKPEHGWSSHYADAARYSAIVVQNLVRVMRKPEPPPKPKPIEAERITLDGLFEDHADRMRSRRERI